jgi:hypothetical protein
MTDFVADAARSAAATLAPDLGRHLPAEVEAALAARAGGQRPDSYREVASLGGVTVSAAALAWTIYNDQRNSTQGPRPEADSIAHQVRSALGDGDAVLPPATDRITEVVATEIIRQSNLARE